MKLITTLFTAIAALGISATSILPATATELDVPIIEHADGDLDTCALGEVRGLKKDGDGFLAVRKGPGMAHEKIDEIVNGDRVWLFDRKGKWLGVVYGTDEVDCSPILKDREVETNGKKGWVHENWIALLAG